MIHMVRYAYLSVEVVFVFTNKQQAILWKSTVPKVFTAEQGNIQKKPIKIQGHKLLTFFYVILRRSFSIAVYYFTFLLFPFFIVFEKNNS